MRHFRTLTAIALSGALVTTAACTTDPNTGQRRISKTALGAVGGLVGGYLVGDLVGGRNDRTAKILGAGIGAIAGGAAGPIWTARRPTFAARRRAPEST